MLDNNLKLCTTERSKLEQAASARIGASTVIILCIMLAALAILLPGRRSWGHYNARRYFLMRQLRCITPYGFTSGERSMLSRSHCKINEALREYHHAAVAHAPEMSTVIINKLLLNENLFSKLPFCPPESPSSHSASSQKAVRGFQQRMHGRSIGSHLLNG